VSWITIIKMSQATISGQKMKIVVKEPCPFPPLKVPACKRVKRHVLMENGKVKPLPVLECPASNSTYMFLKKLVQEKTRVMIMLAAVLRDSSSNTFTAENGITYKVLEPQEKVVIKVTDRNYMRNTTELIENPLDEISAMELLRCPGHVNVIDLIDYMQDNDYLYLVLPYCPGKDLFQRLEARGKPLSEHSARRILRQIIHGLLYMKTQHHVAHRDLSLENIMFSETGDVKIIDLGMCVRMPAPLEGCHVFITKQSRRGKSSYVAPEVARENIFDGHAADVWSLGVILFIMLTLTPLYGHPDDNAWRLIVSGQMDVLLDHYETMGIRAPPLARDLIWRMMQPCPESRLTIEEVLNHPWMLPSEHGTAITTPTTMVSIVSVAPGVPLVHHRHYCPPITKKPNQSHDTHACDSSTDSGHGSGAAYQYSSKRLCFDHLGIRRRPAPAAAASGGPQYQKSTMMIDKDGNYHN